MFQQAYGFMHVSVMEYTVFLDTGLELVAD